MPPVEAVTYRSGGLTCTADLYLPDGPGPVPAVVCGESGVKTKEMIEAPARHLAAAGLAVLAVDYRSVGGSEGEPRGQLFPEQQAEDFRSAVSYLRRRPEVDGARIGLWGNSVAGSVVVAAAIADRRVRAVVAQSPSMLDGWSATLKLMGTPGFAKLRAMLAEDWERREGTHEGATVPWLSFDNVGDHVSQSFTALAEQYPGFRNEILLESHEHFLAWAPGRVIERLAPTPLLIVTNGVDDPYHQLDEIQAAYARAGEPKRLDVLPFDTMGFYTEPGRSAALDRAVGWFDEHLRGPLPAVSAPVAPAGAAT